MTSLVANPDEAVAFLQWLRPTGSWSLTALVPNQPGARSATFTDPQKARAWVVRQSERKANCYFVPSPAPKPTGREGRAVKEDVVNIDVQQCDLDLDKLPEDHPMFALPLAERKERVVRLLRAFTKPGPPSAIIDSGGGLQALWRLAYLMPTSADNIDMAERTNAWLGEQFPAGDSSTKDIGHLFRLPGTINWPDAKKRARGRVPVLAHVIETNALTYADVDFPTPAAAPRVERGDALVELEPEQLAEWLAVVDPANYGVGHHDAWVALSAACHFVTRGFGLAEWLDWCHRDPEYAHEDDEKLQARWDSFKTDRPGKRAGLGTLRKAVSGAGRSDLLRRFSAIEDFREERASAPIEDKESRR